MNEQVKPHTIATAKYFPCRPATIRGAYAAKFEGERLVKKYGGHFTIFPQGNDRFRVEHWT